jgi:hypothetical protein
MTGLLPWLGGTFLQWTACIAVSAPFVALAGGGKTGIWRRLAFLAVFFLGCLLLVRLETTWAFLRSPWQAMLLEAVFALGVILLTRSASSCGLTLKIDRQAWRDAAVVTLLLLLFVLIRNNFLRLMGLAHREGIPGLEFLLYQATLPGIAEELAYRGVIQSQLNGIFGRPWKVFKACLGWGFVITAVIFWAIHAFLIEGLSLSFYWQTLTMQMVAGLVFGWLRERSGSLVPGILAHNLVNLVWTLA